MVLTILSAVMQMFTAASKLPTSRALESKPSVSGGRREARREEGSEGGREGRREGGRERGRERGREGGRKVGKEGGR